MPKSLRGLALSLSNGFTLIRTLLRKNLVNVKAFTLIELLVVISIIAILSAVGLVTYNGIRTKSQDAKIKSDLNAIKKAYEANYDPTANGGQGGYKRLSADGTTSTYFADGKLPKQPNGTSYTFAYGPDATAPNNKTDGYKVTLPTGTTLSDNTTPSVISNQGTVPTSQLNSCDPGNTLANGLVGYWKMDGNANASVSSYNASVAGSVPFVSSGNTAGNFDRSASFNNSSSNYLNPSSNFSFSSPTFSSGFTITAWVKIANASNRKTIYNNGHGVDFEVSGSTLQARLHTSAAWYSGGYGTLSTSAWSFVGLSYNPTNKTFTLYKDNGRSNGTVLNEAYSDGGGDDRIGGADPGFGNFPFNGLIDDVRIYNKQLTQSELSILAGGCILP